MPEARISFADDSFVPTKNRSLSLAIKRPDSLTSLSSLLSVSSGFISPTSSERLQRKPSITSLVSLNTNDGGLEDADISPYLEMERGIELELSKSRVTYELEDLPPLGDELLVSSESEQMTNDQSVPEHWLKSEVHLGEGLTPLQINTCDKGAEDPNNIPHVMEKAPPSQEILINISLNLLTFVGKVNDKLLSIGAAETDRHGYAPLYNKSDYGGFHYRNIFRRWQDCFCNPINSEATDMVSLMERKFYNNLSSRYELTGESSTYINLGSYNYLGFGGVGWCSRAAEAAVNQFGIAGASVRQEVGTQQIHVQLEKLVAEFLGVEAAITFGMGFATNSTNLPGIIDSNCLVLSDRMNHASIILGMRLSGATVRVFKHNDMEDLERKLLKAVTSDSRRWQKIVIVVEGVYSMEGSLVRLPDIIRLKRRYGAYVYLDEAHSIGALGSTGRGVVEHYGCDPADIDVMMGTFTKSFGAAGGYIGGSRRLVDHLRTCSHSTAYANAMPAAVCRQIQSSMSIIMGRDGSDLGRTKILTLARNSLYFRRRLKQMGFIVYGDDFSPVVPLLSFFISKSAALYRNLKKFGIATAVIAYPATPINAARARFCLSASHNKQQLDYVLDVIDRLGDSLEIKYSQLPRDLKPVIY